VTNSYTKQLMHTHSDQQLHQAVNAYTQWPTVTPSS